MTHGNSINASPNLIPSTAEVFATNQAYAVGDYVMYNGQLYRFTQTHSAGAWNAGEVVAAKLADDLVELRGDVDGLYTFNAFDYTGVTSTRWIIASEKWTQVASSSKARSYTLRIPYGVKKIRVTANASNGSYIALLKTYAPVSSATPDYSTGYEARITLEAGTTATYSVASDMVYLYAVLTTSANDNMTPTVVFISEETDEVYTAGVKTLDAFYFDWRLGRYLQSDGTVDSNTHYALSYGYPVGEGQIVKNATTAKDSSDRDFIFTVSSYSGTTFVERVILASGESYTVPKNADSIRISFGYPNSVSDAPNMSKEILDAYFGIKIYGYIQPFGLNSDHEHPVYVAIGPSTTEGLQYNANSRSISRYDYPGYVGRVLDLKAYNLGVSGTGLVCRENGDDNFMDIIYARSDLLSKAKLVTIMYGYGNDVGLDLPVGSFTDYYPYDAEGYHPSGAANVNQMISAGATVMGCLNWCIKWINEHYPYAQLLIIFGAPSLNRDRTVTMTAQSGSTGVAPYTLTFADPYDDPASGSLAYGIKAIGEELEKLKAALGIPMIDMYADGCPFSWYSTYAKKPDDQTEYALFGMANSGGTLVWNSHPIDAGYIMLGKYLAGQIAAMMLH